jgi:hypothetical protein
MVFDMVWYAIFYEGTKSSSLPPDLAQVSKIHQTLKGTSSVPQYKPS